MNPCTVALFRNRPVLPSTLGICWLAVVATGSLMSATPPAVTNNFVAGDFHVLNDNGAWSWFMDERLMVDNGRLLVGSVRERTL